MLHNSQPGAGIDLSALHAMTNLNADLNVFAEVPRFQLAHRVRGLLEITVPRVSSKDT